VIGLRFRHLLILLLLCFAGLAGRASTAPTTSRSSADVVIDNFTFDPPTLVVAPGTRVRWINRDDVPHTVTSSDKRFNGSKALDTDDTFSVTFDSVGTYPYYCAVHPHMTATIVVK
jgi:plastocyanin